MGQIKSIHTNTTTIHLWSITESESELQVLLGTPMSDFIAKHKNILHRKQLMASKLLLQTLGLTDVLFKNKHGKPFLHNGQFISISHSDTFVGIAISDKPVGIDIEKTSDKLTRIISKFLHKNEKKLPNQTNLMQLLQIWTAKESIYKLIGVPGLRFREDIEITRLDKHAGEAMVNEKTKISLFFKNLSEKVLICCAQTY